MNYSSGHVHLHDVYQAYELFGLYWNIYIYPYEITAVITTSKVLSSTLQAARCRRTAASGWSQRVN